MDYVAASRTDPREPGSYSFHLRSGAEELWPAVRTPAAQPRLGVLDLGSNTFHLAVAEVAADGALSLVADPAVPVQLVSALERGALDPASWRRASRALSFLVACARGFDGLDLVGVATGAFRSADNGARFLEAAHCAHGVPLEVLSGAEEARLAFAGACSEAPPGTDAVAVLDLGGGSAELAVGRAGACRFARSLPIGVLRLRHRHVGESGIMTAEDASTLSEAVSLAAQAVTGAARRLRGATLLLTAGTARAIARLLHEGGTDERPVRVERRHVEQLAGHLTGKTPAEIAALGVDPTRAETLGPGAVAISTWMTLLGFEEALVCRRGLREGVLLREAGRRARAASGHARRGDR